MASPSAQDWQRPARRACPCALRVRAPARLPPSRATKTTTTAANPVGSLHDLQMFGIFHAFISLWICFDFSFYLCRVNCESNLSSPHLALDLGSCVGPQHGVGAALGREQHQGGVAVEQRARGVGHARLHLHALGEGGRGRGEKSMSKRWSVKMTLQRARRRVG